MNNKPIQVRYILAWYPDREDKPILWEFVEEGEVFLSHTGSTTFHRICTMEQYQRNREILRSGGWIFEDEKNLTRVKDENKTKQNKKGK
jgi:hypothetical protein